MIKSAKTMGRLELIHWLNELTECDYPKIDNCCDAVAYCQVLDATLPQSGVPLSKLNFNSKSKEDCARNLRVFAAHIKKMKLNFPVDVAGVSNGKF
jgi:microtubule-associated protein, RP/EB family